MEMKQFLLECFAYSDYANKKMLVKLQEIPDKSECVRLLSHLINSQNKWMARILQNPDAAQMSWWDPIYPVDELESKWNQSHEMWSAFLNTKTEEQIFEWIRFTGFDGGQWEARLKDIALQLYNHGIHHRAQMQTIIRQQGLTPDFIDYIGTVYKKLS
jgi:uncharacterized damage-inducible protein DinB